MEAREEVGQVQLKDWYRNVDVVVGKVGIGSCLLRRVVVKGWLGPCQKWIELGLNYW